MRRQTAAVKSGGLGADRNDLAHGLGDNLFGIVEAASALNVAAVTGVSLLRSRGARSGGGADVALGQAVADAHDHCVRYTR